MGEYTGIYRAAVHDINDPDSKGRLRCLVPSVLGDAPSGWAEPALPSAVEVAWSVGDRVWILFDGGDLNNPVYISRMEIRSGDLGPGIVEPVHLSEDVNQVITDSAGNQIFPQDEPPWADGTPGKKHGTLWLDTDDNRRPWFWDTTALDPDTGLPRPRWIDARDPSLDLLTDIPGLPIGEVTLGEIAATLENVAQTATSARNLASTADGRVSASDYDPTPQDSSYYATDAQGNVILGTSWPILDRALIGGVATLTHEEGLIRGVGEYIQVSGVGLPFDGLWTVSNIIPANGTDLPKVQYRITGQADVALAAAPAEAKGFNTVLLDRIEGSVWFTRTRSRTNLCTNPSFEVDLNGWAAVNATAARVQASTYIAGTWSARVTNDATTGDHTMRWRSPDPGIAIQPGQTLSATCFGILDDGQPASAGVGCYASMRFYRSDGSLYSEVNGPATTLVTRNPTVSVEDDDWREMTVTATAPVVDSGLPVTHVVPLVLHNPNANAVWLIDGALVEQAEYPGRYFDGESYDAFWGEPNPNAPGEGLGLPFQSISRMVGGKVVSIYELLDGDWVRWDLTASTQYDQDAGDLKRGTLDPDRIGDRTIDPEKMKTNVVRAYEPLAAGDLVHLYDNNGFFFVRKATSGLENITPYARTTNAVSANSTNWSRTTVPVSDHPVPGIATAVEIAPQSTSVDSAHVWNVDGLNGDQLIRQRAFGVYVWSNRAGEATIWYNIGVSTTSNIVPVAANTWTWVATKPGGRGHGTASVIFKSTGGTQLTDRVRLVGTTVVVDADAMEFFEGVRAFECHGFVLNSATTGEEVPVFTVGYNPLLTGLSSGTQFLSAAPGKASSGSPTKPGRIIQRVGFASDATTLHFQPNFPIRLT